MHCPCRQLAPDPVPQALLAGECRDVLIDLDTAKGNDAPSMSGIGTGRTYVGGAGEQVYRC